MRAEPQELTAVPRCPAPGFRRSGPCPAPGAPRARVRVAAVTVLAAALALAAGCRNEEVTHYRVETGTEPLGMAAGQPAAAGGDSAVAHAGGPAAVPAGMTGDVPLPPTPSGAAALKWSLPRGWTQSNGGSMRYATLRPPGAGKAEVSIVVLPGPAGGELANVNRWRGQIGLSPVDEAALAGARKTVKTKAGPVSLYDFTSEGTVRTRVVAGLAESGGNTWFLKLTGDAEPVAAARPDFLRIVESLHL